MSIDYHVHCGPYVACAVKRVPSTRKTRVCGNAGCKGVFENCPGQARFCHHCGGPIVVGFVPDERDDVDANQVERAIEGALYHPSGDDLHGLCRREGVHLFLPNQRRARAARRYAVDAARGGAELLSFLPDEVSKEAMGFCEDFADELAVLCRFYGEEAVRVRWGLIVWAS